jgi:glycosyltransferase involved in cell wall biosynthesis
VPEPVKGLSRARQAGFVASDGDLVANIDADTILPQGWLRRVLEQFAGDHGLVALSGPYIYHDVPLRVRAAVRAFYWLGFAAYAVNRHVLRTGSMLQGGNFVAARRAFGGDRRVRPGFHLLRRGHGRRPAPARGRQGQVHLRAAGLLVRAPLPGDGVFANGLRYGVNYLWASLRHRPFTREARDHRA